MLKPYLCVACEKVIIGKDEIPSLISLFGKIIIATPEPVPSNAVSPKDWTIFSIWFPETGDENKVLFCCTQILYPDKSQFGEINRGRMVVEPNKRSQMHLQVQGFPVGQPGSYTVRTWLEENQQRVFGPIEFSIEVEINVTPSASA